VEQVRGETNICNTAWRSVLDGGGRTGGKARDFSLIYEKSRRGKNHAPGGKGSRRNTLPIGNALQRGKIWPRSQSSLREEDAGFSSNQREERESCIGKRIEAKRWRTIKVDRENKKEFHCRVVQERGEKKGACLPGKIRIILLGEYVAMMA